MPVCLRSYLGVTSVQLRKNTFRVRASLATPGLGPQGKPVAAASGATGAEHPGAGLRDRAPLHGGHVASLSGHLARVLVEKLEARVLLGQGLRLYRLKAAFLASPVVLALFWQFQER